MWNIFRLFLITYPLTTTIVSSQNIEKDYYYSSEQTDLPDTPSLSDNNKNVTYVNTKNLSGNIELATLTILTTTEQPEDEQGRTDISDIPSRLEVSNDDFQSNSSRKENTKAVTDVHKSNGLIDEDTNSTSGDVKPIQEEVGTEITPTTLTTGPIDSEGFNKEVLFNVGESFSDSSNKEKQEGFSTEISVLETINGEKVERKFNNVQTGADKPIEDISSFMKVDKEFLKSVTENMEIVTDNSNLDLPEELSVIMSLENEEGKTQLPMLNSEFKETNLMDSEDDLEKILIENEQTEATLITTLGYNEEIFPISPPVSAEETISSLENKINTLIEDNIKEATTKAVLTTTIEPSKEITTNIIDMTTYEEMDEEPPNYYEDETSSNKPNVTIIQDYSKLSSINPQPNVTIYQDYSKLSTQNKETEEIDTTINYIDDDTTNNISSENSQETYINDDEEATLTPDSIEDLQNQTENKVFTTELNTDNPITMNPNLTDYLIEEASLLKAVTSKSRQLHKQLNDFSVEQDQEPELKVVSKAELEQVTSNESFESYLETTSLRNLEQEIVKQNITYEIDVRIFGGESRSSKLLPASQELNASIPEEKDKDVMESQVVEVSVSSAPITNQETTISNFLIETTSHETPTTISNLIVEEDSVPPEFTESIDFPFKLFDEIMNKNSSYDNSSISVTTASTTSTTSSSSTTSTTTSRPTTSSTTTPRPITSVTTTPSPTSLITTPRPIEQSTKRRRIETTTPRMRGTSPRTLGDVFRQAYNYVTRLLDLTGLESEGSQRNEVLTTIPMNVQTLPIITTTQKPINEASKYLEIPLSSEDQNERETVEETMKLNSLLQLQSETKLSQGEVSIIDEDYSAESVEDVNLMSDFIKVQKGHKEKINVIETTPATISSAIQKIPKKGKTNKPPTKEELMKKPLPAKEASNSERFSVWVINTTIKITENNSSYDVPTDALMQWNRTQNLIVITWKSPQELNNSLVLNVTGSKTNSGNYYINGIQLTLVKDEELLVLKKNVVILPPRDSTDRSRVIALGDGVQIAISDVYFLRMFSNVKETTEGDIRASSSSQLISDKMWTLEIVMGSILIVALTTLAGFFLLKKYRIWENQKPQSEVAA